MYPNIPINFVFPNLISLPSFKEVENYNPVQYGAYELKKHIFKYLPEYPPEKSEKKK